MSKPLSAFSTKQRPLIILRRLKGGVMDEKRRGLGFISAKQAFHKLKNHERSHELEATMKEANKIRARKVKGVIQ